MTQPVMCHGTLTSVNLVYVKMLRVEKDGNRYKVCAWFNNMDHDDEGVPVFWADTQYKAQEWRVKQNVKSLEVTYQR